jgi:hypothetical protein
MDLNRISELLRRLTARQEKVVRLYFGLGCQRPHSAEEMAGEFGVSRGVILSILAAAEKRLAQEGLTASQLRWKAGCGTEIADRTETRVRCASRQPGLPRSSRAQLRTVREDRT